MMPLMTESERVESLQRQVDDLAARLATAHEQTAQAIDNTERSIRQTAAALEQAQRFMTMYKEEVAKRPDAPSAALGESKEGK